MSAAEDSTYTTQKGDTLSKIAQKVYGDKERWKDIYDANRDVLKDPNKLWVNQQLVIPGGVVTIQQPVPQDTPTAWPEASAEWQTAVALGGSSYVEQNGLQFYQGTSYKTQGRRYTNSYPSLKEFFESNGMITGITIRDAEIEGYQVVTISAVRDGLLAQHSWGEEKYSGISIPVPNICDIYTGKILNLAELYDDGELWGTSTTDLEWGGVSYSIDYIGKDEQNYDQWDKWTEWDADGSRYALITVPRTYTLTIPKGYDGLALLVTPVTEGSTSRPDTEKYIMDDWKDGSYLMRVSDLYNFLNGR